MAWVQIISKYILFKALLISIYWAQIFYLTETLNFIEFSSPMIKILLSSPIFIKHSLLLYKSQLFYSLQNIKHSFGQTQFWFKNKKNIWSLKSKQYFFGKKVIVLNKDELTNIIKNTLSSNFDLVQLLSLEGLNNQEQELYQSLTTIPEQTKQLQGYFQVLDDGNNFEQGQQHQQQHPSTQPKKIEIKEQIVLIENDHLKFLQNNITNMTKQLQESIPKQVVIPHPSDEQKQRLMLLVIRMQIILQKEHLIVIDPLIPNRLIITPYWDITKEWLDDFQNIIVLFQENTRQLLFEGDNRIENIIDVSHEFMLDLENSIQHSIRNNDFFYYFILNRVSNLQYIQYLVDIGCLPDKEECFEIWDSYSKLLGYDFIRNYKKFIQNKQLNSN